MNVKILYSFLAGVLVSAIGFYAYGQGKKTYRGPRKIEHPIDPLIANRWSPRAMSGEPITKNELMSLFEAARWAPSSYNAQPWRFIYGVRGMPQWDKLFDLLVPFNKSWAKNGGALILALSRKTFERNGEPSPTHSLDTGAATENLMLQATSQGLVSHGMEGFDYDRARKELNIPDDYDVEAMYVIGRPAAASTLPEELRSKEVSGPRKTVSEFIFEGEFPKESETKG